MEHCIIAMMNEWHCVYVFSCARRAKIGCVLKEKRQKKKAVLVHSRTNKAREIAKNRESHLHGR
jgi:hypothetical protein